MATKETSVQTCSEQLVQVVPILVRLIRRGIRQSDPLMSPAHVRILDYLSRCPGASLSELSSELDITNATASSHIDRLVKRHLVDRLENPSERRRVVLNLTPQGARSLSMAKVASTKAISEMLAAVPATKLNRISDALHLIEEAARQFNETESVSLSAED